MHVFRKMEPEQARIHRVLLIICIQLLKGLKSGDGVIVLSYRVSYDNVWCPGAGTRRARRARQLRHVIAMLRIRLYHTASRFVLRDPAILRIIHSEKSLLLLCTHSLILYAPKSHFSHSLLWLNLEVLRSSP